MDDFSGDRSGFISRVISDPIRLRRYGGLALIIAMLAVAGGQLLTGLTAGMLTALAWVVAPVIAFGIGVGDAFFVRHGRGKRRILLSILASIIAVLTSCAILAAISDASGTWTQDLVAAALYVLLYAGIVIGLAGLIALGIGRGEDYVSSRIDRMSREDW